MDDQQRLHPGADMEGFVSEMMAFTGLDEADIAFIRHTAPAVLKHERELTEALYDHLLTFPATARFFVKADGTPDPQRLERRKHALGRWLRDTAEVAMTHEFTYYLLSVSLAHSHRQYGPGGKVPPQFMVGAISLAQTALARILQRELDDLEQAFEAALAWNKLLLVHLNVLLLGYFLPPPQASGTRC